MKILWMMTGLCLALGLGGCVTKSTTTGGDLEVNHQTLGAADKAIGRLEAIEPLVADRPAVAEAIADAKSALVDVKLNAEQQETVHGKPKDEIPYSPTEADKARKKSSSEHAGGGFWKALLGIGVTLASLAWAFLKTTAAKQAVEAVENLAGAGLQVKAKAASGTLTAEDVKATYAAAVALAPPKVKATIEETLTRIKKKLPSTTAAQPPG